MLSIPPLPTLAEKRLRALRALQAVYLRHLSDPRSLTDPHWYEYEYADYTGVRKDLLSGSFDRAEVIQGYATHTW